MGAASTVAPALAPRSPRMPQKPYREVVVGGLKTACLSRAQMMALMVKDCLAAREDSRGGRSSFSPPTGMSFRLPLPMRNFVASTNSPT
jgi:hypothetical protein